MLTPRNYEIWKYRSRLYFQMRKLTGHTEIPDLGWDMWPDISDVWGDVL